MRSRKLYPSALNISLCCTSVFEKLAILSLVDFPPSSLCLTARRLLAGDNSDVGHGGVADCKPNRSDVAWPYLCPCRLRVAVLEKANGNYLRDVGPVSDFGELPSNAENGVGDEDTHELKVCAVALRRDILNAGPQWLDARLDENAPAIQFASADFLLNCRLLFATIVGVAEILV